MSAKKLLDSFVESTDLELDPTFEDNTTGNVCRAFYAISGDKKRRILVCVTQEYAEDILTFDQDFEKSIAAINKKLLYLYEKVKQQPSKFEREKDFMLSRQNQH